MKEMHFDLKENILKCTPSLDSYLKANSGNVIWKVLQFFEKKCIRRIKFNQKKFKQIIQTERQKEECIIWKTLSVFVWVVPSRSITLHYSSNVCFKCCLYWKFEMFVAFKRMVLAQQFEVMGCDNRMHWIRFCYFYVHLFNVHYYVSVEPCCLL